MPGSMTRGTMERAKASEANMTWVAVIAVGSTAVGLVTCL